MKLLFLIFVSSGNMYLSYFFTQITSEIMHKMTNFKRCNFSSSTVSKFTLQKWRTMMQLTTSIT